MGSMFFVLEFLEPFFIYFFLFFLGRTLVTWGCVGIVSMCPSILLGGCCAVEDIV